MFSRQVALFAMFSEHCCTRLFPPVEMTHRSSGRLFFSDGIATIKLGNLWNLKTRSFRPSKADLASSPELVLTWYFSIADIPQRLFFVDRDENKIYQPKSFLIDVDSQPLFCNQTTLLNFMNAERLAISLNQNQSMALRLTTSKQVQ